MVTNILPKLDRDVGSRCRLTMERAADLVIFKRVAISS